MIHDADLQRQAVKSAEAAFATALAIEAAQEGRPYPDPRKAYVIYSEAAILDMGRNRQLTRRQLARALEALQGIANHCVEPSARLRAQAALEDVARMRP